MRAIWEDVVIAESNNTLLVEGNHYFPLTAVKQEYLVPSNTHTTCPWKGEASYYNIVLDKKENPDAAWYYPEPKEGAAELKGRIAFWHGVEITN